MQHSIVRPLTPLIALLIAVAAASLLVQSAHAAPLSTDMGPLHLATDVDLPLGAPLGVPVALPAAPGGLALPSGIASVPAAAQGVLAQPGAAFSTSALPGLGLGPRASAQGTGGPAPGPAKALEPSSQGAEMAAAGALAAAGTFALKLEPVRRGVFLLALPLYSRLRRSQLLENGVRERIYKAIEAHPGLSIIQVCRAAKVGWGTAVYHLQRLERDRLIASRRDGQYRRFFLNGQAPDPGAVSLAERTLAHPLARRIAGFVQANPEAAQKDVCLALGISPPLASKWLGRLLEAGLLTSRREWKLVRYSPAPGLHEALAAREAPPIGAPALEARVPA